MLKVVFQCDCVYPDLPFWRYRNFVGHYWSRVALSDSVHRFCNSATPRHDGQVKHSGLNQEELPTNYCSHTQNVSYFRRTSFSSRTAYLLVEPLAISCWVCHIIPENFLSHVNKKQLRILRSLYFDGFNFPASPVYKDLERSVPCDGEFAGENTQTYYA